MAKFIAAALAISILLLAAFATAPPAFPGGTDASVTFKEYGTGFPLGSKRIEIAFTDTGIPATAARTLPNGAARLYIQAQNSSPLRATASFDEDGTPEADYVSPLFTVADGAEVEMVPAGALVGVVRAENGTAIPASISFACENAALPTPSLNASESGMFRATLPEGSCTATASAQGMSGTASVQVRKGEASSADITVRAPQPLPPISESPQLQFIAFILIIALLVVAAFVAYYLLARRPPEGPAEAHHPQRKGKAGLLVLLLTAIALAPNAATLSLNMTGSDHTYDILQGLGRVPNMQALTVSGVTDSIYGCSGTTFVEISDNGQSYAAIGSSETISPQRFSLSFPNTGAHRYVRVRNAECWLSSTSLQIAEKPDLVVSSIRFGGELQTGVPVNITAVLSNTGGALAADPSSTIIVRFYDNVVSQQSIIGELQVNRSEAVWGEGGATEKTVLWMPPVLGPRTIYVSAYISPPAPGLEAGEENNIASKGVFIEAGPGERRSATVELSTAPSSAGPGYEGQIALSAVYRDTLTRQPIIGANCMAFEEGNAIGHQMGESEAAYHWSRDSMQPGVGIYIFSAECAKPGYVPAEGAAFLPVNSPGAQQVEVRLDEGAFRGQIVTHRRALGSPLQKIKVRVERAGPEALAFGREGVMINNYPAVRIDTDAPLRDGRYWLEQGSSFIEWTFEMDRISGDFLTVSFEPEPVPARTTIIAAFIAPVRTVCTRRQESVEIRPGEKSGEVGTPLYYEITVRNNDDLDCPPSEFLLRLNESRMGWRYEFASTHVPVQPGKSNVTFISVEPPLGEQPGTYGFRITASDPEGHSGPRFQDLPFADASYSVSSPRLFSGLEAGIAGEGALPAGPGAAFTLSARYYNLTNGSIGSCSVISGLVGAKGAPMRSNGTHFLLGLDLSRRDPGVYPFVIECEAPAHKPRAFTGNITLLPHTSPKRYPGVAAAPALQRAAGSPFAFSVRTANREECNGSRQFAISASPPEGWSAPVESDAPAIQCGSEAESIVHLSPPTGLQRGLYFIPVSAAYSNGSEFSTTAYALAAASQSQPDVLSCIFGDAEESAQGLESGGDPCLTWTGAHTYQLRLSGGEVTVAGRTSGDNCSSTVSVEASEDGTSFAVAATVSTVSSADFSATFANRGYTRLRLADPVCGLARTALMYGTEPGSQSPELSVASADFPKMVQGSAAQVTAVIRNTGQSTYSSYTAGVALRTPEGETIPLAFRTIYSHAANSDQSVTFDFTPRVSGRFDLVVTADYANEIREADESDNSLAIPGVAVSQPPRSISAHLLPGWNLVPFISGAQVSHNCTLSEAYAYDAKSGSMLQLDARSLAFASDGDADAFASLHGTSQVPKDAGAFGGAWAYSEGECELAYLLENASSQSWQPFSQLESGMGGSVVAVLPWMAGSTPAAAFGACGADAWEWDPSSQGWARLSPSGPLAAGGAGKAAYLRAGGACRQG